MKRISLTLAVGTLSLLLGSGCRVTVIGAGSATYETCGDSSDCSISTDVCVEIPAISGGSSQNSCTYECDQDSDCFAGGRCMSFDGLRNFCVQACTTSSQCEIGWSCFDPEDGDGFVCLPGTGAPIPTQSTYDSCSSSDQCIDTADECFAYSTDTASVGSCTRSCTADSQCPSGRCLSLDGGTSSQCMQICTTDASCEVGWSCNAIPGGGAAACLPGTTPAGIAAYDECPFDTTPDPCTAGTGCWGITVDGVMAGVCSDTCSSSAECPIDSRGNSGACITFPGQSALCFESCSGPADCQTGWACKNSANGISFPSICVPVD